MPIDAVLLLHLAYEARQYCTAGVLVDAASGLPWLARTLDWELPLLRELTIDVIFTRGATPVFRATTFAGYSGVLTAMRPGASVSTPSVAIY